MILLDASSPLPPGTPWWAAALAALAASPGVGAIIVAWLQYRAKKPEPDIKALQEQVSTHDAQIKAVASTDSAAVKAAADAVTQLRHDFEARKKEDDERRERAGRLASEDREKLHAAVNGAREKVAEVAGLVRGIMERDHGRR